MSIRELREAAGMRQFELAARMDVKPPSVSAWENGMAMPTVENVLKLADIFGVTTDEVLGRSRPGA